MTPRTEAGKINSRAGLAIMLLLLAAWFVVSPVGAQGATVVVARISGPVTPTMASYFERSIAQAEQDEAEALAIVLDTPGGAVDVTQEIVQFFRNAEVPIIVFVGPAGAQAASAGSLITLAGHAAGMAPETVIGAASPVDGSGADIEETLYQKLTEDLKATMRNLTTRRGETAVELAEAMIEDAKAVTADEALEAGLIDAVAGDLDDLLVELDGLTVEVNGQEVTLQTAGAAQEASGLSAVEQILHALSNPLLIGLLLTIGVQAILIELSSPGGWVAGFVGFVCLALGLYGLGTLPANWLGLGLLVLAFVLFILEVKTPATGVLAIAGVITFLAGLLVLFNSPGTPQFARISLAGAIGITAFASIFFLFIVAKALQAQTREPLIGDEALVGTVGPVRVALAPGKKAEAGQNQGTVLINGELWRAVADEEIDRGEQIIVKSVDGFTLRVKRLTQ
ncbi:MAG: nodulation protein NfeD [Chloroflexota bacterium]|nr:MAG: nodulation protein NfeD [Chloroflexota bacterium]